jgi:hypothetical protein
MNFLPSLLNWHAANAPTNLPKEVPYEKPQDTYISVMDPTRPSDTESLAELLLRKINDTWQGMKDPNKVVGVLSREAINPLNYLSAPAKAVAVTTGSAGILATLMKLGTITPSKAVSTGNQAGAFRPSASRLLPSSLTELSNRTTTILNDNLPRPGFRDFRTPEELAEDIVLAKMIAPKELQKYGAPEFQADPFLPHVRNPERNPPAALAEHYSLSDLINDYRSQEVLRKNASRAFAYTEAKDYPPFMPYLEKDDKKMMETLDLYPRLGDDVRAFMGQLKDEKSIFKLQYTEAKNEILDTSAAIARILTTAGYTPEQLSKKTLQQLVGFAQKEERALLEKEAKSVQALTEHTVRRTVELQTKQKLPPESKGLVQLENEKDLATETAFQNICCGAGRVDQNTMKYVPAWDPITGKREPGLGTVPVSGDNFFGRVKRGESLMFSYRPNGIPEATIELNATNGSIREIAGKNNDPMDKGLKDAVLKALAPVQKQISAKLTSDIKMTGNAAADARINEYLRYARAFPDDADDFIRLARGIVNHRGEFDAEGYAIIP